MNVPGPDDLFECPYDSTHMVRYQRMPYHIALCRKRNPCTVMATCHFNALHNVLKPELRYHLSVCPDKYRIYNDLPMDKSENGTYIKGCTDLPQYKETVIQSTEDWDSEIQNNKIFVWGESFKYDPNIVGPDDYCTTLSSERDSYLAQILREKHLKTKVLEGDDGSFTRLPKHTPKVLSNINQFKTSITRTSLETSATRNQAKETADLAATFSSSIRLAPRKMTTQSGTESQKSQSGKMSSLSTNSVQNETNNNEASKYDQAPEPSSGKKESDENNNGDGAKNNSGERNE